MRKIQFAVLITIILFLASCSTSIDNQINSDYVPNGEMIPNSIIINDPRLYKINDPQLYKEIKSFYVHKEERIPNHRIDTSPQLYKNILQEENESFSLRVFVVAYTLTNDLIPTNTTSSYAFELITSEKLSIELTCNNNSIYNLDLEPKRSIDYTTTIPNNNFVGMCNSGDNVEIEIKNKDEIVFETEFEYFVELTDIGVDGFHIYTQNQYNTNNYIYIGLGYLILTILGIIIYRYLYKININKSLSSEPVKVRKLIDIEIIIILMFLISVVLYFGTISLSKQLYNNSHFSDVYVSMTTATVFDIDFDNLTLEKVEAIESEGELITYKSGTLATVVELQLDYSLIKDEIEVVLSDFDGEKVCSSQRCILYGPKPAIRLTFTDGETNFTFKIDKGTTVYITGSNAVANQDFFTFHFSSGYEDEINHIYQEVLNAYELNKESE